MAAKQNVDLTLEQAKELQDALIAAYSQPEFQQKLHKLFKDAAGDQMKEMTARSEVCLPLQIPVVSKYGFPADRKGVSASLRAFNKPELQNEELAQQAMRLAYLVNPSAQDMEFLERMGVTESPLLKDTPKPAPEPTPAAPLPEPTPAPEPKPASTGEVTLTVEQAKELQDSLESAYAQPEFQQKLHKSFKEAAGDPMKETIARQELCLPIQIPIVAKFGFTADQKGVSASLKAFRNPALQTEELSQQAMRMGYLVNPSFQDMDFLKKMGITESPLIKDAPTPAPEPDQPPEPQAAPAPEPEEVPESGIVLTVEQALEFQSSLIEAYGKLEFQTKLHYELARVDGDPAEEEKARSACCLPIQLPLVSRYGFQPNRIGVAQSMQALSNPDLLANGQVQEQVQMLSILLNPEEQDLAWVIALGVTTSPLFRDPVSVVSLVKIVGLTAPVNPSPTVLGINPEAQPVAVNGHRGWALSWVEQERGFVVETFFGEYVCLPAENLQVYLPPPPENGGFDVAWPPDLPGLMENFSGQVAESLKSKSFCVVQMTKPEDQEAGVLSETDELSGWSALMPEFRDKLLGGNPVGKSRWLEGDEFDDPDSWIGSADSSLEVLAEALRPHCPEFGFRNGGRGKTMLRQVDPAEDAENARLALPMERIVNGDEVGNMLKFTKQSKISMIYFLYGNGGSLKIDYASGQQSSIHIPIQAGQLVLIDQTQAAFSYHPTSKCLSLQSWILREELPGEVDVRPDFGMADWDLTVRHQDPTYGESGETVDVMAMSALTPGHVNSAPSYWAMMQYGGDVVIEVPKNRWDSDVYWDPAGEGWKMYVNHFGFCEDFMDFDHKFFGLTKSEGDSMDPGARKSLESGYATLVNGGWNRQSLQGAEIGMFIGNCGSDFLDLWPNRGKPGHTPEQLMHFKTDFSNNRLPWVLGLKGPTLCSDTACSASLTATSLGHSLMRPTEPNAMASAATRQIKCALVMGINGIFDVNFPIALCKAGMLTHKGRCFSFDQSADGFARGDGCSGMYYEVHNKEVLSKYAILVGSCINQDGRSASLTAPNGPAQQECIRHSLREADFSPLDSHIAEMHGTGTSLGDPIELGALKAVMMKPGGKVREKPIVNCTSKSNLGHTEGNAGISGLMKCVLMGCYAVASPGVHLHHYNSHIEYAGYPVLFNPELIDQRVDWGYLGVSSFGFSGCNARGDVYCSATNGPRRTLPLGNDFGYSRHLTTMPKIGEANMTGALLNRTEDADVFSFDWSGLFQSGNPIQLGTTFQISGSWSNFLDMEAMVFDQDQGVYAWAFRFDDTLTEEFRIHTDYFFDSIICPATKKAGRESLILGPGTAPKGYTWRVDGRSEGAEPGDICKVKFWWDEEEEKKHVDWEIVRGEAREEIEAMADIPVYDHRYGVKGTWTAWASTELSPVKGLGHIHETTFRIGSNGYEEFYIVRDLSDDQQIYPAISTMKDTKIGVRGPDSNRRGRCWRVQGDTGDRITLRLRVRNGGIAVSVVSSSFRDRTWNRPELGIDDGTYFVEGSWISPDIGLIPMQPVRSKPNVFRAQVKMSDKGSGNFRILVDQEPQQAFYPEMRDAQSNQAAALGPDHLGSGLCWKIVGEPSAVVQITLDLTKADKRQRVTWDFV